MARSLAQNAIALLIELAERGEIDPWDVQVIEVIDRFLSQLQPVQTREDGRAPYEDDLSQSGQAFLYASMLVLLKADTLARLESDQPELEPEEEEFFMAEGSTDAPLPRNLEKRIRRRAVARPPQNRKVTLPELIVQLELMAATLSESRPRRARSRRAKPPSRSQAVRAIAQLAHQENLSEIATALDVFLSEHWDEMGQGEDWLDFEMLLDLWSHPENYSFAGPIKPINLAPAHSPQGDRVGIFWALLFLSAQSKVELAQEEFYQDLKVRSLANLTEAQIADLSTFALPD